VDFISIAKLGDEVIIKAKVNKIGEIVASTTAVFLKDDKIIAQGKHNCYLRKEPKL
jgi:acyl-coenzyme A thioesterase PaaI-like protein